MKIYPFFHPHSAALILLIRHALCYGLALCCNPDLSAAPLQAFEEMQTLERLEENVWLDNTDAVEVVIRNTQTDPTSAERQAPSAQTSHFERVLKPRYVAEIANAARVTKLDPALIHAVIATESHYNAKATSIKGAYGLMQMMPMTAQTLSDIPVQKWTAAEQILHGAHYLKTLMDMFDGNLSLALAAYNAGPQAVKNHQFNIPPFAETRQYVSRVLGAYQFIQSHTLSD